MRTVRRVRYTMTSYWSQRVSFYKYSVIVYFTTQPTVALLASCRSYFPTGHRENTFFVDRGGGGLVGETGNRTSRRCLDKYIHIFGLANKRYALFIPLQDNNYSSNPCIPMIPTEKFLWQLFCASFTGTILLPAGCFIFGVELLLRRNFLSDIHHIILIILKLRLGSFKAKLNYSILRSFHKICSSFYQMVSYSNGFYFFSNTDEKASYSLSCFGLMAKRMVLK